VSSVLRPHQHSIGYMGDGFYLQVKRPNQQYQSTEGDATKEKENNENNYTVSQKKGHYTLVHIFAKYWPIFTRATLC